MPGEAWRALVRKYIVYDIPDEMAACLDCAAVRCSDERYETCVNRLIRAAAVRAARTSTTTAADAAVGRH
jgi:hypothetical protein